MPPTDVWPHMSTFATAVAHAHAAGCPTAVGWPGVASLGITKSTPQDAVVVCVLKLDTWPKHDCELKNYKNLQAKWSLEQRVHDRRGRSTAQCTFKLDVL